jgi:hypothetical protein
MRDDLRAEKTPVAGRALRRKIVATAKSTAASAELS